VLIFKNKIKYNYVIITTSVVIGKKLLGVIQKLSFWHYQ